MQSRASCKDKAVSLTPGVCILLEEGEGALVLPAVQAGRQEGVAAV